MKRIYRWEVVVLLLASLQLTACKQTLDAAAEEEKGPAKVEHLKGAQPARVTLTESAAKRLDIQTDKIRDVELEGTMRRVIPYAAVLYDPDGDTWTYTNPEPLLYVRHHITVDSIDGEAAVLSEGPPSGTAVVIVGAAELYGSEVEFEEE
jgi:hypothetical protein